jgi:hypothetical protein
LARPDFQRFSKKLLRFRPKSLLFATLVGSRFDDGARDGRRRIANAMRILLQQKNTGLYFKESGVWTQSAAEAVDFLSSTKAMAYCATHRISGVQLVLKFDQEHYDIVMPMMASRREQTAHA